MSRVAALLTIVALVLAACGGDEAPSGPVDGHPTTLAGTSWTVVAINGIQVGRGAQPAFGFNGTVARGSGGCNTFGGSYRYEPTTGELRFSELGMTAMACAEPARTQAETAFMQVLGQPSLIASIQPDGHLVLTGAGGRLDLVAGGQTIVD